MFNKEMKMALKSHHFIINPNLGDKNMKLWMMKMKGVGVLWLPFYPNISLLGMAMGIHEGGDMPRVPI